MHITQILLDAVQAVPEEWYMALLKSTPTAAVLGMMCWWFAMRLEKILENFRQAMERNTNALMVAVVNTQHLDDAIKPLAEKLKEDSAAAVK